MVEVFCQDAVASRVGARLTLSSLGSASAGACAAPSSVVCGGASSLTGSPTAAPTVAAPTAAESGASAGLVLALGAGAVAVPTAAWLGYRWLRGGAKAGVKAVPHGGARAGAAQPAALP